MNSMNTIFGPVGPDCNESSTNVDMSSADLTAYVDSAVSHLASRVSKPVITIWGEIRGSLSTGRFEWSFGARSSGNPHALIGYVMPKSGTLVGMGLSLNRSDIKLKVAVTN